LVAEIRIHDRVHPLQFERCVPEAKLEFVFDGIPLNVFGVDLLVFLEVIFLQVEHN
jgi:hypothetical protein